LKIITAAGFNTNEFVSASLEKDYAHYCHFIHSMRSIKAQTKVFMFGRRHFFFESYIFDKKTVILR